MTLAVTLERFWAYELMHNPIWKWLALVGVLLGTFIVGKILSVLLAGRGRRLRDSKRTATLGVLLNSAAKPVQMTAFALGLYFAQSFLVLDADAAEAVPGPIRTFWLQLAKAIAAVAVAWFVFRLVDILELFLRKWTSRTRTTLDDQLVPMVRKTLRVFIIIVAALFVAQNIFRMNIGSLLAGLGIGGLAFALAAKDSLANLFGSIVIFADRPFAMGDRVVIQGQDGVVEEVGFRSTKIRTLTGHLVTVPNSIVANEAVENIGRRPSIKRVLNVTVTYDTPPDKLQRAVEILREMLTARTDSFPADQPPRVYFSDFNADSLNIVVYYWFAPPDWWEYLAFTHEFNMELLRRYNDEGIEFAFPTQTLYLKPDGEFPAALRHMDSPGPRVGT